MERRKTREKKFELRREYHNANPAAKQNELMLRDPLLVKLSNSAYALSQNHNHAGTEYGMTIQVSNKELHGGMARKLQRRRF